MTDLTVWHPEAWINGRWLAVRCRPIDGGVALEGYPGTLTPTFFDSEADAQARCDALNHAERESRKPR